MRTVNELESQRENVLPLAVKRKRTGLRIKGTKKLFSPLRDIVVGECDTLYCVLVCVCFSVYVLYVLYVFVCLLCFLRWCNLLQFVSVFHSGSIMSRTRCISHAVHIYREFVENTSDLQIMF